MSKKQPLDDDLRQGFLDNLPQAQVNPDAEKRFDSAIERAARPKQSKSETPAADDSYNDTQTHSDTTADTSD